MGRIGVFCLFFFTFSNTFGQFGFEERSKSNSFGSQIWGLNRESNYSSENQNSQLKTTWNGPAQSFNYHNTWNDPTSNRKGYQSETSQNGKTVNENSQRLSTSLSKPGFPTWNSNSKSSSETLPSKERKTTLFMPQIWNSYSNSESNAISGYDNNKQRDQTQISNSNLPTKLNPYGKPQSNSFEEQTDDSSEEEIWSPQNSKPIKWQSNHSQGVKWTPNTNKRLNKPPTTARTPSFFQITNSPSKNHFILDQLDDNDWYFGRESDFPQIDVNSNLHIDVGQLWNFHKQNQPGQNNRESITEGNTHHQFNTPTNKTQTTKATSSRKKQHQQHSGPNIDTTNTKRNNFQNRKNRHAEHTPRCQCVDVTVCSKEDVLFEERDDTWSPPGQRTCEKLSDVCCTKPKSLPIADNFQLRKSPHPICGQLRFTDGERKETGFPWLLRLETFGGNLNCEASLIHSQMGLTAAHCVAKMKPEDLYVKAGMSSYEDSYLVRKVIKIIVHPNFDEEEPRNDLALLVFELPFQTNENLNTICFPVINEKWDLNRCLVSGWTTRPLADDTFKEGTLEFPPQSECQNIIMANSPRPTILHDSFFCANQKNPNISCLGAPGSPVICPSKNLHNGFLQIGLVSQSIGCGYIGRPGLITNVLKFIDWINEVAMDLNLFDGASISDLN